LENVILFCFLYLDDRLFLVIGQPLSTNPPSPSKNPNTRSKLFSHPLGVKSAALYPIMLVVYK